MKSSITVFSMIVLDYKLSAKLVNGELIINVNLHNNMHSYRVGWQISTQGDAVRCTWLISSDSPFDSEWVYCIWIFTECVIRFLSFYEHSSSDTMFFITSFCWVGNLPWRQRSCNNRLWWISKHIGKEELI